MITVLQMVLTVNSTSYNATVDGKHLFFYKHRADFTKLQDIRYVELQGDLSDVWVKLEDQTCSV